MKKIQSSTLRINISKVNANYMTSLPKNTLIDWCERLNVKYRKSMNRKTLTDILISYTKDIEFNDWIECVINSSLSNELHLLYSLEEWFIISSVLSSTSIDGELQNEKFQKITKVRNIQKNVSNLNKLNEILEKNKIGCWE